VRDPQPVEHLGIAHQRSAAFPAGHQHHIGAGKVGDREVRLHPKGAGVGSLKPRLFGDKAKLHPWQAGQDFVRADRVQAARPSKIRIAIYTAQPRRISPAPSVAFPIRVALG
jgi:hypothetical protein